MKKISITLILLASLMFIGNATAQTSACPSSPTTYYVNSAATGSGNGCDWTNAFTALPATLVRGDTYYLAGGSYDGFYIFNTPESGVSLITIKKATSSDHGTSVGWNDTYGAQAVFSAAGDVFWILNGYLTIDGATGSGTSGYGIKFVSTGSGDWGGGVIDIPSYESAYAVVNNVTVTHVEVQGQGVNNGANGIYSNLWGNSNGWVFQYNYIHDVYEWFGTSGGNNVTIDHNYMQNAGSSWPDGQQGVNHHAAGITFSGQNVTISNNVFENMIGTSNTTYIEPQADNGVNTYIYGNVFWASSPNELTSQWTISLTSADIINGLYVYNNTFYGLHSNVPGVSGGDVTGSTNVVVENNLFQNCLNPVSFNNVNQQSNNVTNSGAATFESTAIGNFQLIQHTSQGVSLPSPYNIDAAGNNRGAYGNWDVGAFEHVGNTYFVDYAGGSDGNSGTSTSAAWKHSPGDPAASGNVVSYLNPGDTVVFKGGVVYQFSSSVANDVINAVASGTSSDHIVYMSGHLLNPPWPDATDRAVIDGTNSGTSYPQYTGIISISSQDYIDIRGFEIKNLPETVGQQQAALIGYVGNSGGHITIDNNVLHDSGAMGIILQGQWQANTPSGAIISNNSIYRTNSHNLMLRYGWQNVTIENNFFDTPGFPVYTESGTGNSGTAGDNIDLAPDYAGPTCTPQVNVIIKGNTFDYSNLLYGQAPTKSHILVSASQTNLNIEDNVFQGYPNVSSIDTAGTINGGQIINNLFNDQVQTYEGIIRFYTDQGNMQTTTNVNILNNTIVSSMIGDAGMGIFYFAAGNNTNTPPLFTHIMIQNNIVDTNSNIDELFDVNNQVLDIPTLNLSNNVYNAGTFRWPFYINNNTYDFSTWVPFLQSQGAVNADTASASGSVGFVNRAGGDFLLSTTDTLAKGNGLNLYSIVTTDINGNIRPVTGNWDIGAYQFKASQTLTSPDLSVSVTGNGEVLGPDISCGVNTLNICNNPSINPSAIVTLTAQPTTGFIFSGWSGGGCSGTGVCMVTMNTSQNVIANFTTSSVVYGDVNGALNNSGQPVVTIADAEMTAQAVVGLITLTPTQLQAAEVDGTGNLDIYDAYLIAEYAVGLITKFPIQP